jgi:hypothetical protein
MATTQLTSRPQAPVRTRSAGDTRAAFRPLFVDLAIPLGSYYVLRAAGVGLVLSLALSSVVPAGRAVTGLIRSRDVNALAVLIVAVNLVSIAISFWSGNARVMLAKDGAITSTIGIAILISAFTSRPLMTAGLRPFIVKADPARAAAFDRLRATSARFRRLEQLFSLAWGLACLAECVARVICAVTLPVGTVVWLGTVLTIGFIAAGIVSGSFFSIPMEKMVANAR